MLQLVRFHLVWGFGVVNCSGDIYISSGLSLAAYRLYPYPGLMIPHPWPTMISTCTVSHGHFVYKDPFRITKAVNALETF